MPRAFEAPLFFEGLSVVGGLVPCVFKAPLFCEAPPLDVRGLVTRGDGGVVWRLLEQERVEDDGGGAKDAAAASETKGKGAKKKGKQGAK